MSSSTPPSTLAGGLDGGRGCRLAASSAVSQPRVKSAWRDRSARDIEARQDQSNRRFGDLRGRLPGTWTERTAWRSACGEHHGATLGPPLAGTDSTSPSSGAATRQPTRDSVEGRRRGGKKAVLLDRTKIFLKGHMVLSAVPLTYVSLGSVSSLGGGLEAKNLFSVLTLTRTRF